MKRLGFAFTDEDIALLKQLQERLESTLGKLSYVGVIRWALRQADRNV